MTPSNPSIREIRKLVREAFELSSEAMQESIRTQVRNRALLTMRQPALYLRRFEQNGPPPQPAAAVPGPHLSSPPPAGAPPRPAALSRREREVLRLLVDGKSSREIASELGISFKTAACHRANIMSKLDVHETASLVRRAILWGLVRV